MKDIYGIDVVYVTQKSKEKLEAENASLREKLEIAKEAIEKATYDLHNEFEQPINVFIGDPLREALIKIKKLESKGGGDEA